MRYEAIFQQDTVCNHIYNESMGLEVPSFPSNMESKSSIVVRLKQQTVTGLQTHGYGDQRHCGAGVGFLSAHEIRAFIC